MPICALKQASELEFNRWKNLDTGEVTIEVPALGLQLDEETFAALFDVGDKRASVKLKDVAAKAAKVEIRRTPKPAEAKPVPEQKKTAPVGMVTGSTPEKMLKILKEFGPLTRPEWMARTIAAGVADSNANATVYNLRDKKLVEQFDDEKSGGLTKWRCL